MGHEATLVCHSLDARVNLDESTPSRFVVLRSRVVGMQNLPGLPHTSSKEGARDLFFARSYRAMKDHLPAWQFYPGDWRKDSGVQALDYETRGIWFEILLLMHENQPPGKLTLNGQPMPDDALARILGLEVAKLQQT